MKKIYLLLLFPPFYLFAQQKNDSGKVIILKNIITNGIRIVHATGHMPESKDGIIYAGKKNEVILVDSFDANKAINNTRQILGRIPGLNIVETETGGFTANGIATRGLNPSQSIEMNTRQNSYNISADVYGYNEAYYIPPMEAVSRIEMVRGASSLQFGAQLGGMVNYITNEAPKNKINEFVLSLTTGSFGLFNLFSSFGGNRKKWTYYSFLQNRVLQGWRPNSTQWQLSGFGKLQYLISKLENLSLEYSLLRNKIQMPGGLTDSMFISDPKISTRGRNWLNSPWNIIAAKYSKVFSERTSLSINSSILFSSRNLVWKNEDGGAAALDEIDPNTGNFQKREVEKETMNNTTTEIRLFHTYGSLGNPCSLSAGIRVAYGHFHRQGGGPGTEGSNFDLSLSGPYKYDLRFTNFNIAPFVENIFKVNKHFSITPGIRIEYLRSTVLGYKKVDDVQIFPNESKERKFLLGGIGLEYKTSAYSNIYGNITEGYRPIDYSQLTAFGLTSRIDPNLKDSKGWNSELGYRGTIKNYLNYDISLFYLLYKNRIGTIFVNGGANDSYTLRTNISNSFHRGVESYFELNLLKFLNHHSKESLNIYNSLSLIDAHYTQGEYAGKRVEVSVKYINRIGVSYYSSNISETLQFNYVGNSYGDASNITLSENPAAGLITAYTVIDYSSSYKVGKIIFKVGINNLLNKIYFTRRTDEYPGPGIIPSTGRNFYIGIGTKI